jgi:predicted Zn finger-like uncharacterized protein
MASSRIVCPECESVLRPAQPLPDGKRVKCPKCKTMFTTPGLVEDRGGRPEKARAGAKKDGIKKPEDGIKKSPAPPAPKKPADDDDEEESGGGTYGVIKEDELNEEEEEARNISYAPDMSIKDLRGPAQAKVVGPSNGLILAGALGAILNLFGLAVQVWPFMFKEYVVDHDVVLEKHYRSSSDKKTQEKIKNIPKERKDLKGEELTIVEDATEEEVTRRIITAIANFLGAVYCGIQIFAAVKMQNLESYGWSMAAAILGMIPLGNCCILSFPMGIWALMVLRDKKVIDGFNYKPD